MPFIKYFYQLVAGLVVLSAMMLIGLSIFHKVELPPEMSGKLMGIIEIALGVGLYKDAEESVE